MTLLSWRLVCDSIHRSCVTGICLGYRPGSSRRILPAPIHSPLSSRHPILQQDWKATLISLFSKNYLLEEEQGLSMGEMLTVNFRQPRVLVIHWFQL
jgi:hypothetical protein